MVSGPSEAKIFGKTGSSTESSQSGYDMTGEHDLVTHFCYLGILT